MIRYWCQVPSQFTVHFSVIPGLPEISRKYLITERWQRKTERQKQKDNRFMHFYASDGKERVSYFLSE